MYLHEYNMSHVTNRLNTRHIKLTHRMPRPLYQDSKDQEHHG
jgi:hypothetical protein